MFIDNLRSLQNNHFDLNARCFLVFFIRTNINKLFRVSRTVFIIELRFFLFFFSFILTNICSSSLQCTFLYIQVRLAKLINQRRKWTNFNFICLFFRSIIIALLIYQPVQSNVLPLFVLHAEFFPEIKKKKKKKETCVISAFTTSLD